ncbi:MAG TPA: hypothetical protein VFJ30_11905 [Phycisphaerae bacterium]|nr:hypothetical protein [Phycisphaerae bacterium]
MMVRARTSRSAAGLTLLEMMIALTIVATAVVILIPTVVETVDTARRVQCTNNLGLITRALRWYADDKGCVPLNYSWYGMAPGGGAPGSWPRWALGGLSPYVGGPAGGPMGPGDLRGLDETEFAPAYICPAADLEAVYAEHADDKYHACYWTNIAIRANRGWNILFADYMGTAPPGDDTDSGGEARYFGYVCPNVGRHWRSVYHPRLETIRNPAGMVFIGDTRNTDFQDPDGYHYNAAGDYAMKPGWGWFPGYLGFDRHQGSMMLGYVDGHARAFAEEELEEYSFFTYGGATGDFTLNYSGNYGCTPETRGHHEHIFPAKYGDAE